MTALQNAGRQAGVSHKCMHCIATDGVGCVAPIGKLMKYSTSQIINFQKVSFGKVILRQNAFFSSNNFGSSKLGAIVRIELSSRWLILLLQLNVGLTDL